MDKIDPSLSLAYWFSNELTAYILLQGGVQVRGVRGRVLHGAGARQPHQGSHRQTRAADLRLRRLQGKIFFFKNFTISMNK